MSHVRVAYIDLTLAMSSPSVSAFKRIGRASRWSDEQNEFIYAALPEWHEFSLVNNGKLSGDDKKLLEWKKSKAREILENPLFKELPEGVRRNFNTNGSTDTVFFISLILR
jgi:hypothetical protein